MARAIVVVLAALLALSGPSAPVADAQAPEVWVGRDHTGELFAIAFDQTAAHVRVAGPFGPFAGPYSLESASPDGLNSFWRQHGSDSTGWRDTFYFRMALYPDAPTRGTLIFGQTMLEHPVCLYQLGPARTGCQP